MATSKACLVSFILLFTFLVFPHDVLSHNLPKVDDDTGVSCEELQRFGSSIGIAQNYDDEEPPCLQRIFSSTKPTKLEPQRDHHTHQLGLKDTTGLQRVGTSDVPLDYYTHHPNVVKSGHQIDSIKGFQWADPPEVRPNYYNHHPNIAKSDRQIRSIKDADPPEVQPNNYYIHHLPIAKSGRQIDSIKGVDPPEVQPNYYTHHIAKSGRQIDSIKGVDPPEVQPNYYTHYLPIAKSGRQIDSIKGFQRAAAHPDAQPDYHTYRRLPIAKSGRHIDSTGHHHYDTKHDEIEILNMMNYEDGDETQHYKDDNQNIKKRNFHDETRTMKKINYDDGTETLKNKNYEDEIAMRYRRMVKP